MYFFTSNMFPVIVVVVVFFFHRVMEDRRLRTIKYYYRGNLPGFLIYLSVQQLRLLIILMRRFFSVKNPLKSTIITTDLCFIPT